MNRGIPQAKRPLTPRQREVVATIARLTASAGYAPTYSELATALGVTKTAVFESLRGLAAKGALTYVPQSPRTLRLVEGGPR